MYCGYLCYWRNISHLYCLGAAQHHQNTKVGRLRRRLRGLPRGVPHAGQQKALILFLILLQFTPERGAVS